ncbi:MAG: short-chain dehydrogenase [Bryobacteraceae bacterium]|nr:MAG: short-chain dehydrogenase [Bryobacteraceae bacterium]
MMSFDGTVTLVLGATSGIGGALARRIRAAGGAVIPAGRNREKLAAIAAELGEAGIEFDAASFDSVESAVQQAVSRYGRLDGVAVCSGSLLLKPAHLTTEAEYRATMAASIDAAFAAVRAAAKAMMNTGGSMVLVSSAAARIGLANHEAIAAAKGAIIGLALSAAASYAARGIRVNCVAPGLTETPLTARITGNETSRKASEAMHALGRIGRPEDVASAMAWLLDPENSWVTGQVIGVDGGLANVRPR